MYQADQLRSVEEVSDHQPHLSRPADRQRRQPQLLRRARRHPGARRARLRRRRDRRHGHAVAIEEVPRGLLRQHGRQHAARSGGRHEGAGAALSVDRHRSRRHLRPLGRRLRHGGRDVPLSGLLQGRHLAKPATTTTASTRTTGPRSGRACSRRTPTARPTTTTRRTRLVAKNLKGKLLLAHGTMDNNVPPYNTLLVVDALIKANKDFDLLMLPNRGHGFGNEPLHDAPPLGLLRPVTCSAPSRRRNTSCTRRPRDGKHHSRIW